MVKRSVLKFDRVYRNLYHAIIKNYHGRKLYLKVNLSGRMITICECFYIDRPVRNGVKAIPNKLTTLKCNCDDLTDVLATEIDKRFYGVEFSEKETNESAEEYIMKYLNGRKKYRFLIFVDDEGVLKTRLRNRVHRNIYMEIKRVGSRGLIQTCHYYDRCYKQNDRYVTPYDLKTIYFDYSFEKILEIVNDELNCDFTDVVITSDTFNFEKKDVPVCGSI